MGEEAGHDDEVPLDQVFDPLASLRHVGDPEVDVFVQGTVFLDIIFTGLAAMPKSGTEVWAEGMGSCPGGIANLGVAAARLGLKTSLGAAFGDDDYGEFCWRSLEEQEGIDLSRSQRYPHWHTPVTVSVSVGGDRRMITHGHDAPRVGHRHDRQVPRARSVLLDLDAERPLGQGHPERQWAERAAADGALLFADIGWDPTGVWSHGRPRPARPVLRVHAERRRGHGLHPHRLRARRALRPRRPRAARRRHQRPRRRGRHRLRDRGGGLVPALRVEAIDPTGAGDVFDAGMLVGTLAGWPLLDRMNFATLCSSLAVQEFGGSLAAPGLGRHRRLVAAGAPPADVERRRPVGAAPLRVPRRPRRRGAPRRRAPRRRDDRQAVRRPGHDRHLRTPVDHHTAHRGDPMNRTRTTLVALLAGAGLALGACAPGGSADGSDESARPAPGAVKTDAASLGDVTLTVWDQEVRGGQEKQMATLNAEFQKKYPNITIKRVSRSFDDLVKTLRLALTRRRRPGRGAGQQHALADGGVRQGRPARQPRPLRRGLRLGQALPAVGAQRRVLLARRQDLRLRVALRHAAGR